MGLTAEQMLRAEHALVIGHRGYCAIAPENTLASFRLAISHHADLVELDYHHSKDGMPMVFHDRTLDRTTNARRVWKRRRLKLAHKTSHELQTLDAGSWFDAQFAGEKIPTLTAALEVICGGGKPAVIEHKSGDAKTVAHLLRKGDWTDKVVVISFDWKFLRELHALEPQVVLGALGPPARLSNGRRPIHVRRGLGARLKDLAKTGAKLAVWNGRISKRAIRLANARDVGVWVYTVNNARAAKRLVKMGVRGIITNEVERITEALRSEPIINQGRAAGRHAVLRVLARKFRRRG